MQNTAEVVVFWVFAVPLVLSAAGVLLAKNPVKAAMSLVAAFFFMAAIYVLLAAHLIAVMQILVYAGAIMVLFLFVIMLLSTGDEHLIEERRTVMQFMGAIGVVAIVAVLAAAIGQTAVGEPVGLAADFGTVKAVGRVLYSQYLLPFEVTSLLLLVAIVGAVIVAKERV